MGSINLKVKIININKMNSKKFVKFFWSTIISFALLLGTMAYTISCNDDEECPNVAVNIGKMTSAQCESKCKDSGYQEHFMDSGNCCCRN